MKRGSSPRKFWLEQTFDLEEARVLAAADVIVVSNDEEEVELVEVELVDPWGTNKSRYT